MDRERRLWSLVLLIMASAARCRRSDETDSELEISRRVFIAASLVTETDATVFLITANESFIFETREKKPGDKSPAEAERGELGTRREEVDWQCNVGENRRSRTTTES